jgi:hypothetical protein
MAIEYDFQSVLRDAMPFLFIFPTGSLHDGQASTFSDMYSMHSGHFLEIYPVGLLESIEACGFFMPTSSGHY